MRKTPISKATADQARMNTCDCLDHHAIRDLRRVTPISGRIPAEITDMALRTLKATGNCEPAATPQSATPNANRITDATHRPLRDCQLDANRTIVEGEANPKPPMQATKNETAMTISSLKIFPPQFSFLDRRKTAIPKTG
jgi:hypothetical protein